MRVLIATADLYSKAGGGESYYAALIERNPTIDFWFYQWSTEANYGWSDETRETAPPANAHRIALRSNYRDRHQDFDLEALNLAFADMPMTREAERIALILDMAASVSGRTFDILEIPDYLVHGWLLPSALCYFGAAIGKVALAMHGTISDALFQNWGTTEAGDLSLLERTESLLYRISDIRYGLGERYIGAWAATEGLPAQLLGHQHVFDYGRFTRGREYDREPRETIPDLAFIGRQDRWKGPDLFLGLCAQLPKGSYRHIHLYGPATEVAGASSVGALTDIANNRGLKFQSNRVLPRPMLQELLARRTMVTVLPSRRDTFNLAALESLLHGCPTVISTRAGAVDFLDAAFPGIPYIKLAVEDMAASLPAIRDLCSRYEAYRRLLREYLEGRDPLPYGRPIEPIYREETTADHDSVGVAEQLASDIIGHVHDRVLPLAEQSVRSDFQGTFAGTRGWSGYQMGPEVFETALDVGVKFACAAADLDVPDDLRPIGRPRQDSDPMIRELCEIISAADRSRIARLLAVLERERGNDLLFATYLLRCFRLTGRSPEAEVEMVARVLANSNLAEEAKVARLMLIEGEKAAYDYLKAQVAPSALVEEPGIVERLEFGNPLEPKVSVIVSIYNGARKIPHFVGRLALMTEEARGMTEFIFVDSNSVDDTRAVLLGCLRDRQRTAPLCARYLRTERRETIQHAWNRGIVAARAPYLSFLGVDEAVQPDAIPVLGALLDRRPDVDWVQGSAVVTEVDDDGTFVRDVFPHRRSTGSQNIHYLECTHIGYVGAVYRRDLHTRFGLYDPRFRAAGDNEFKNRILPFIRVSTLPDVLGTFLNYPERRTTESPVAEIEDLRAWYVHRTPAGIRYAFERQSDQACIDQFYRALKYRRSFLGDDSTDLEYASALASYLSRHRPEAYRIIEIFVPAVATLLNGYRGLDELLQRAMPPSLIEVELRAKRIHDSLWEIAQATLTQENHGFTNAYWYRNDNRNQQHYFPWPSRQRRFALGKPLGWGDLAGARNLAELVNACMRPENVGGEGNATRRQNDARAGLAGEAVVPVLILTDESPPSRTRLVQLLDALTALGERVTALVVGAQADHALRRSAPASVYFIDGTVELRPLLAAAQLIVIAGADEADAPALSRHVALATGYGRPLLVGAGLETTLRKQGVDVAFDGIPKYESGESLWAEVRHLIDEPAARARLGAISAAIGERLRGAGLVVGEAAPASSAAITWGPEISALNGMLHRCFAGGPGGREAAERLMEHLRSEDDEAPRIDAVLRALFIDKTAPVLHGGDIIFTVLRQAHSVRSTAGALALLYAGSERRDGLLPILLAGLLGSLTMERGGTPLDDWRCGKTGPPPSAHREVPPRLAVLVHAEAGEYGRLSSLVADVLDPLVQQAGAEYWINRELPPLNGVVAPVQKPASKAAVLAALAQADLVICLGLSSAGLSGDSLELALMAIRSGRPVLGNRQMFWFLGDGAAGFVFDDAAAVEREAARLLFDATAARRNVMELSRTLFNRPSTASIWETQRARHLDKLWEQFEGQAYEAVIEEASALLAEKPEGDLHYLTALALHHIGRTPAVALAHYNRALELGVEPYWVRFHRARLHQALGNQRESEMDYEAVIAGASASLAERPEGGLHYLIAYALQHLGRNLEQALAHYDRGLELGVDEYWVRLHRGQLRQAMGYEAGAGADLARAAALNGEDREAGDPLQSAGPAGPWRRFELMDLDEAAGQKQPSRWPWRNWVLRKRQTVEQLIADADRARDSRDWRSAAAGYQKALDVDPALAAIWVQLGHALKERGHRLAAEEAYRRALAIDDSSADTCLQLGHVLKIQGRVHEAADAYLGALSREPTLADARAELQRLGYNNSQIQQALGQGRFDDWQRKIISREHRSGPWGKPFGATGKTRGKANSPVISMYRGATEGSLLSE